MRQIMEPIFAKFSASITDCQQMESAPEMLA